MPNLNEEAKGKIRKLKGDEPIPYSLLLLAEETIEAINHYIEDAEIYVYEIDPAIVASYVLVQIDKDTAEIKYIAVMEDKQGKGIGKLLLQDATERAKKNAYKWLLIGTGDVATKQLNLYQKAGFEPFDRKTNFFLDNYPEPIYENGLQLKDMVMLRKKL